MDCSKKSKKRRLTRKLLWKNKMIWHVRWKKRWTIWSSTLQCLRNLRKWSLENKSKKSKECHWVSMIRKSRKRICLSSDKMRAVSQNIATISFSMPRPAIDMKVAEVWLSMGSQSLTFPGLYLRRNKDLSKNWFSVYREAKFWRASTSVTLSWKTLMEWLRLRQSLYSCFKKANIFEIELRAFVQLSRQKSLHSLRMDREAPSLSNKWSKSLKTKYTPWITWYK